jgi:hypothetical protein
MLARVLLLSVALLNLVPGIVAIMPSRSRALYGVALDAPALAVTMRHRAVLLACVGVLLAVAAFDERWWAPASLVAWASKLAFLAIYALEGFPAGPLARVAWADLAALVVLAIVSALRL